MTAWFTGTSTGNTYNVGQNYRNADGSTSRANADGSFTNNNTGRTSVGSSQSTSVLRGNSSLGTSNRGGSGPGVPSAGTGVIRTAGPGVAGVAPGGVPVAAGAAVNPGVAGSGSGWWSVGTPSQLTQIVMGGRNVPMDTGMSDGETMEARWGDFGGSLGGLGVMFMDGLAAASVRTDVVGRAIAGTPGAIASGAIDFAGFLDARRTEVLSRVGPARDGYSGATYGNRSIPLGGGGDRWMTGGGF